MELTDHWVRSDALGNDYIVVDPARLPFALTPQAARLICDRHRGVGSDGIVALVPADGVADFGVRILNPDGSEAEKSGNGIRIFAKFLRDHGYTIRDRFSVRTLGGIVGVSLERVAGRVTIVAADMGTASFGSIDAIELDGRQVSVHAVSMGNPHCVVIVPDLAAVDVPALGPRIERHPAFRHRTNVQFAQVLSPHAVRIRIWERGVGETLASGSSSCAVVAACHRAGLVYREVRVAMPGGELAVSLRDDGEMRIRGPVEEIAAGRFSPELLRALGARRARD